MAAGLFVLVQGSTSGGWTVVAGPVDQAGADAAVTSTLTQNPQAFVVVATGARGFHATQTVVAAPAPQI